jgi:hypothetical protein
MKSIFCTGEGKAGRELCKGMAIFLFLALCFPGGVFAYEPDEPPESRETVGRMSSLLDLKGVLDPEEKARIKAKLLNPRDRSASTEELVRTEGPFDFPREFTVNPVFFAQFRVEIPNIDNFPESGGVIVGLGLDLMHGQIFITPKIGLMVSGSHAISRVPGEPKSDIGAFGGGILFGADLGINIGNTELAFFVSVKPEFSYLKLQGEDSYWTLVQMASDLVIGLKTEHYKLYLECIRAGVRPGEDKLFFYSFIPGIGVMVIF